MKLFYGFLCIVGVLLPYGAFMPWLIEHGLDITQLVSDATVTNIATFAWLDVLVSAIVLLGFIWVEGRRQDMKHLWIPAVCTCTVGVSLGLPLFLLMREYHINSLRQG